MNFKSFLSLSDRNKIYIKSRSNRKKGFGSFFSGVISHYFFLVALTFLTMMSIEVKIQIRWAHNPLFLIMANKLFLTIFKVEAWEHLDVTWKKSVLDMFFQWLCQWLQLLQILPCLLVTLWSQDLGRLNAISHVTNTNLKSKNPQVDWLTISR